MCNSKAKPQLRTKKTAKLRRQYSEKNNSEQKLKVGWNKEMLKFRTSEKMYCCIF